MSRPLIDGTPLLRAYARLRGRRLARRNAVETQAATLLRLVRAAADTRFGRAHGFAAIRSVADFQTRVPLRSYEEFWADWLAPTFPVLDDATWPGRIPYFALSSGTSSGRTKHIPVSRAMLRANARAGTDLLAHHVRAAPGSDVLGGKSFFLGGSVAMAALGHGVRAGDLSGIARLETPRWSVPFVYPPVDDALEADWEAKIDRLARLSPAEPITCLAGTPAWLLLFFERLAAVTGRRDLRAIYPRLDLLVYGGVSFAPYEAAFRTWLPGGGVDLREAYAASEGFVASADRGVGEGLALNLDIGLFFEFVPIDEWDAERPTRLTLADAPAGEYGLVVSTCAGLWAYRLGDVVELIPGAVPRVRVTGRTSEFLSAFGEHVSGRELETAVLAAARDAGRRVADYTVAPLYPEHGEAAGRHLFVVELDRAPDDPARFAAALDGALRAANADYEAHRAGDYQLRPPEVVFVPPGAFADWMRARGKLGGQNKVPRVAVAPAVREDVMALADAGRAAGRRRET